MSAVTLSLPEFSKNVNSDNKISNEPDISSNKKWQWKVEMPILNVILRKQVE